MVQIYTMNFSPGFSSKKGFFGYLMRRAFGEIELAATEQQADIVFTSVLGRVIPAFPRKTIAIIFENKRPNFKFHDYALSSDFDDFDGRNVRCPYWYTQLAWPGFEEPFASAIPDNKWNHGYEPLIGIDALLEPRNGKALSAREKFCCFVAGNPELHRLHAAVILSKIKPVEVFGNVARNPLRRSKLELLKDYRFNLCTENSIFPGYYTEKILHAWVAGCVPLYFSDAMYREDFNPRALINRGNFPSIAEFADDVKKLEYAQVERARILSEPLLVRRPSLDPVIEFLAAAGRKIGGDFSH